jgi:hypothetical protein
MVLSISKALTLPTQGTLTLTHQQISTRESMQNFLTTYFGGQRSREAACKLQLKNSENPTHPSLRSYFTVVFQHTSDLT